MTTDETADGDANNNDENKEEQDAVRSDSDILLDATFAQINLGPKGLHPSTEFDPSKWQRYTYKWWVRLPDVYPLFWCRIHVSVATVTASTALVHYSFENLHDANIEVNVGDYLFDFLKGFERVWLKNDLTSGDKSERILPWKNGFHSIPRAKSVMVLRPSQITTVTEEAHRQEDGSWFMGHFGDCIPGHTYTFQLIYGGLPSNVFTWTSPE